MSRCQDPYTWIDKRGNHHIIAHSQGSVNLCQVFFSFFFFFLDSNFKILSQTMMSRTQASNTDGWKPGNSAGVHFFSASAEGPWTASQEAVYCGDVTLTNGSKAHLYVQPPLLRPRIRISQPTAHFLLLVCHCSLAFEN